jgi:flagellar biosynthesis/type III secretory pathway protein FliH
METQRRTIEEEKDAFTPLFETDDPPSPADAAVSPGGVANTNGELDFFVSSLEDVKKEAYLAGVADGERQTLANMSGQLNEQIARWQQMLTELSSQIALEVESFLKLIEERTVAVSVKIAEKIVHNELKLDPAAVRERVKNALGMCKSDTGIQVRVNTNDIVFLRQLTTPDSVGDAGADGVTPKPGLSVTSLVGDPAVEVGGFIVETPTATFDHTIRGQLLKIETELAALYESTDG